ncbi:MAG TPA: glycogen synthase GlgA [Desulfobacterales bacterium]|nr:glycogen synthase GlgA [Desulfobacterales bacterium]
MKQLKLLYLASELSPFAIAGGLADVTSALPKALKNLNQEVRLMIPKYKSINERKYVLREVIRLREIPVTLGSETAIASVKSAFLPDSKVQVYFIEVGDYFNRPGIYNDPKTNQPYPDNAIRYAFFCKAAIETLKKLSWQPDIIHCNDWQTAFVPVYLKTLYMGDPFFKGVKTIYTIHNLTTQGEFDVNVAEKIDFDKSQVKEGGMFYKDGKLNLTKAAILFSDFITTVSENYAHEILTDDRIGFGFKDILEEKENKFEGIMNGVDYSVWSPEKDKYIPFKYSKEDLTPKKENKKALLMRLGMPFKENTPVIGMISKLIELKGFDLLLEIIDDLMMEDLQLVIHGDGQRDIAETLLSYAKKFPEKLSVSVTFDEKMAHLIEAGSDMFLMPSKYEPCGLNQIYSMRYGTVPIVSPVGGLFDSVEDIDEETGEGTGFVMEDLSSKSLLHAIKRALGYFKDKEKWTELQKRIMEEDFSWDISAKRYVDIYDRVISGEDF